MKKKRLVQKYIITKIKDPEADVDALVLEFKDKNSQLSIYHWAEEMRKKGHYDLYSDIMKRLKSHGFEGVKR